MTKSITSEQTAEYKRIRVYHCPHCETRLFTHEEPTDDSFSTQTKRRRTTMRLAWHPCRNCHSTFFVRTSYESGPTMYPLLYYIYTCQRCGSARQTAERIVGQARELTPRNKRGKTPHPFK